MKRDRAFTLIEVLISSAIISLVAIGIYSAFASGISVWKRSNESRAYERKIIRFFDRLTRELRNTFKISSIAFEGTGDSVAFPALIESITDEGEQRFEIGKISYSLNEDNTLCKQKEMYSELFQEEREVECEELIKEVFELKFSYCFLDNITGEYKWKDEWVEGQQDSIPKAVKIELLLEEDQEESKFIKTILIPTGTGEQKIELITKR